MRDSVERLANGAAASRVLLFDSLPLIASEAAWRDSSGTLRRGDLDAALIAGIREAADLRHRFDSVEIALVSPMLAEEVSAGTPAIVAAYSSIWRSPTCSTMPMLATASDGPRPLSRIVRCPAA